MAELRHNRLHSCDNPSQFTVSTAVLLVVIAAGLSLSALR